MIGIVKKLYIAKKDKAPSLQDVVEVEAGKGVVGDRYHKEQGTFSAKLSGKRKREITFIAAEEIDTFNATQNESLGYGQIRRNVVTQGILLKDLIGQEFSIGQAQFLGIEYCEPCAHLAATVHEKVMPHLIHTGLRAAILKSGKIQMETK